MQLWLFPINQLPNTLARFTMLQNKSRQSGAVVKILKPDLVALIKIK